MSLAVSYCLQFESLIFRSFVHKMPKYAVAKGNKCGIYDSWEECQKQINGFKGAKYKKFKTLREAEEYMKENVASNSACHLKNEIQEVHVLDPVIKAVKLESVNAYPVPKISPTNASLNDLNKRITVLESKFSIFTDNINLKFDNILKRLLDLEGRLSHVSNSNEVNGSEEQTVRRGRKRKNEPDRSTESTSTEPEDLVEVTDLVESSDRTSKLPKCEIVDEIDGYSQGWMRHYYPDDSGFLTTPQGAVRVYTDGACTNNGKRGAKAGIGVWFNHNHPLNLAVPVRGRATNNNAEIQAANAAIVQASKAGIRRLHIFTDSMFVINCITAWIYKWKRNNWVVTGGGPVKNKIELVELDTSIQTLMDTVTWTHVKGHCGDVGNTQADLLARKGAETYRAS